MKFSELIDHAIVCIKGFNPVIKTLDSHADEFIAQVSPLSNLKPKLPKYSDALPFVTVHGSLRESLHQISFLRVHALSRIPQGKALQSIFLIVRSWHARWEFH